LISEGEAQRERPGDVETIGKPRAHRFTRTNDFIGLAAPLRNFFRAATFKRIAMCGPARLSDRRLLIFGASPERPTIRGALSSGTATRPISFRAAMQPKTCESKTNISPNETKGFASLVVSH
jgi:hypothetical protein